MKEIRKQDFWSPYLQTMIDNQLNDCEACAETTKEKQSTLAGHIPTPEGPFRHQPDQQGPDLNATLTNVAY